MNTRISLGQAEALLVGITQRRAWVVAADGVSVVACANMAIHDATILSGFFSHGPTDAEKRANARLVAAAPALAAEVVLLRRELARADAYAVPAARYVRAFHEEARLDADGRSRGHGPHLAAQHEAVEALGALLRVRA
ncbi:MAG: hypothetical protein EKK55_02285 [Rhodocyclaceae bacterium]|nr:MAG: hypothetical protein EKK55_02285 [Rhodocyclaceae bacterium]